ncbi:hypothetical protein SUGI_1141260 [Cryptomeria japonica]|nr:hypothetical protein SUGI_1141260 [Cryptomeria japonica]
MRELCIQICQIISHISEGSRDEIDLLIRADLFHPLVRFLYSEGQIDVKKEAAYDIFSAICGGKEEQIEYFVDLGSPELVGDLLTLEDAMLTKAWLQYIETMLKVVVGSHKYTNRFHSTNI